MPPRQIFKGKMVRVEKILQCQDFIVLCLSLIYDSFTNLWCYFKAVYLVLGLSCRWYDVLGSMAGSEALPVEPFCLWGLGGGPYSLSLLPDLWGRERTGTAVSRLLGWLSEGTCLYCSVWYLASRRVGRYHHHFHSWISLSSHERLRATWTVFFDSRLAKNTKYYW